MAQSMHAGIDTFVGLPRSPGHRLNGAASSRMTHADCRPVLNTLGVLLAIPGMGAAFWRGVGWWKFPWATCLLRVWVRQYRPEPPQAWQGIRFPAPSAWCQPRPPQTPQGPLPPPEPEDVCRWGGGVEFVELSAILTAFRLLRPYDAGSTCAHARATVRPTIAYDTK
jgi:hypothetical protein